MYMTSVHWSLTQFTPAAMDVVPRTVLSSFHLHAHPLLEAHLKASVSELRLSEVAVNALERIFSVVVTLAGLIVFSFFLGSRRALKCLL